MVMALTSTVYVLIIFFQIYTFLKILVEIFYTDILNNNEITNFAFTELT